MAVCASNDLAVVDLDIKSQSIATLFCCNHFTSNNYYSSFIPIAVGVMVEECDTLGAEGDCLMTIILHEKMRSVGVEC